MIISMPKDFFVTIAYVDEKFLEISTQVNESFRDKGEYDVYQIIDDEYANNQSGGNI